TRLLHETIKKVGDDLDGLRFNTAISQMMIFANALQKAPAISPASAQAFVQLLAPFAPHLGEELWTRLGGAAPVQAAAWPVFDPALLESETQKVVVQVNGKRRGEVELPKDADEAAARAAAEADPAVAPHLEGKTIRRVIYVPGRIFNIVVA